MAILSTSNLVSEQRYEISDARRIESAVRNDFDTTITSVFTNTSQGYIIRGFSLVTAGSIGAPANGLQMVVDGGAVLHINASVSGTIFQTPFATPNQVLNAASNTNVSGSFAANTINYVGIDYNRFADPTTSIPKYIWSETSNTEIQTIAPAAQTLTYKIYITNSVWAANVLPIAIVSTDPIGNVVTITDARWMIYSLETGGINPNPGHVYPWAAGRDQPPVSISAANNSQNPFMGGDKQLTCFKDWADAIMSTFLEIKGTPFWFSGSGGGNLPSIQSLFQDLGNTVVTGSGSIAHGVSPVDKITPTAAGQINWDQDINLRVIGSSLTYTLTANPTSTGISMADDQVCYVTLVRDIAIVPNIVFITGSAVLTSVGSVVWTSGLRPGDYVKIASNTVAGYYQILSVDSGYQVTLTSLVSSADGTGVQGAKAKYAFGSYQVSNTPTTNRNLYIANRELVPQGADVFWLFMRQDNGGEARAYIRFLGAELDNGEDREVDGTTSEELLMYIGAAEQSSFAPLYVSAYNVYSGGSAAVLPEITQITVGAGSTISPSQYFLINSASNSRKYIAWFKVNGAGAVPNVANTTAVLEIDILSADTATIVATKLTAAINNITYYKDFTATSSSNAVTVTNRSAGTTTPASNGNVGAPFAIVEMQAGTGFGNAFINDGDNLTLAIKKVDKALGDLEFSLNSPTYDEVVRVVSSGAVPPASIPGPVSPGTNITLPNNSRLGNVPAQYTVGSGVLQVFLNGQFLDVKSSNYAEVGSAGTSSNVIQILITLVPGDELEFRFGGGSGGGGRPGPTGATGPAGAAGATGATGADALNGPIPISTKTSSYTILSSDGFLKGNCTAGSMTFTLPTAASSTSRVFYIKRIDNSINTIFIAAAGSDLIDGMSVISLVVQYQSVSLVCDGATWSIF